MNGGVLKFLCARRGYGLIAPDDGGPDVFVHVTQFQKAGLVPEDGMRLAFQRQPTKEGRIAATNLRPESSLI